MEYMIRHMLKEDIQQVQNVARKSWYSTYKNIIPLAIQKSFLQSAYSNESLERRLAASYFFVAESDEEVIGFANFSPLKEDGEIELGSIYLDPAYQGVGVGSALLKKGISTIEGIQKVYINVEKDNLIGKTFYIAKGFKQVAEFDDPFDGHNLRTIRMVLML
ncbi:GNAT family N-acetyltransferase [Peribacillus sp. FSL H8-0477]|uniref:GNAT family N-acetyltransferase n=1 Tax=Peribacillus sp. FSL H8-0477 TaxID=2921388 RepID=UPI0030FC4876